MNFPKWTRQAAAEVRETDYTAAITQAFQDLAEADPVKTNTLAVVESCVGLIADPFLCAATTGSPISPRTLYVAARDCLRLGNSVWAIATTGGSLSLQRAHKWKVYGDSMEPETWSYDLELKAPSGTIKKMLPSASVLHFRLAGDAGSDWIGKAPWEWAILTSDAMSEMERAIRDESRSIVGRVWIAPDGVPQAQVDGMARTLRMVKGGANVVSETTAAGFGQGKASAPQRDWMPTQVGADHKVGNVQMRSEVESSIASVYGVSPAWFSVNATAPSIQATKRMAYLGRTLPLAKLMTEQIAEKIDESFAIFWRDVASQGVDVQLRARAAKDLMELVVDKDAVLEYVGLPFQAAIVETPPEAEI